jgi:hypothetical protein
MTDQFSMITTGMKDAQWMSAQDKEKVLRQWETFLKSGCQREHFGKALYTHLTLHCSFIAHYDINGFYAEYFRYGDDAVHFLSQFNRTKHCQSIEYGGDMWIRNGNDVVSEYYDINNAMVDIAAKYIPGLVAIFSGKQKEADLAIARQLMRKHGINPEY